MRVKLSWIEWLVFVSIVGVLSGLLMSPGDFDRNHRYPPPDSLPVIGLAGIAGEYYLGDGLGMNLSLSILPDGRYSLISSGCTGVGHRESGHVRPTEGRYVLSPSGPSEPGIERTLILIGWDRRRYLIPLGEMQAFRDAIIERREPRDDLHGCFYIRLSIVPADGLPDSPAEWASDLREDLLLGRVLEVSVVGLAKVGRAKVNLGVNDGLREGDVLTVQRRGDATVRHLLVVSVADGSCMADEWFPSTSEYPLEPGQAVVAVRMKEEEGQH